MPPGIRGTVQDIVLQGLTDQRHRLHHYRRLTTAVSRGEVDLAALTTPKPR